MEGSLGGVEVHAWGWSSPDTDTRRAGCFQPGTHVIANRGSTLVTLLSFE